MRELVTIVHPDAGEAHVLAISLPHWRARGWVPAVEQAEPQGAGVEQDAAPVEDEPVKQETTRRRRASSKESD